MSRDALPEFIDVDQLSLAVEVIQDLVVVYDEHARIVIANNRLLTATGYTREELIGRPVLTLLPEALREELTPRMLAYAVAPVPRALGDGPMGRIERKDGSTFEVQLANAPLSASVGNLVVSTIREVRHLSLEEIQFRGLLEANPDATLICSPEGNVAISNASATRLFEQEHVALFNQPLLSLFQSTDTAMLTHWLDECRDASLAGAVPLETHSLEVDVVRKDGSVVPVEVSVSPMPTDQGQSLRVIVRDISERKRLQCEAEARKDGFLASVSHELRTPLTSVLGYGELLADLELSDLSEHARGLLEVVLRNARRELRLVDDLLTMVKIGEGAFRIHSSRVNFSELVHNAVEASIPVAQRAQVRVSVDNGGEDAYVMGDADRLSQAVDNLLTNSLKFSPAAGEVAVALSADAEMVTVSVTNEGEGIRDADVEHVFERLYRGGNAVVAQKQGVGLGLSIVRSIVEAHQGNVRAARTATTTCFEIKLPRAAQAAGSIPGPRQSGPTQCGPARHASAQGAD